MQKAPLGNNSEDLGSRAADILLSIVPGQVTSVKLGPGCLLCRKSSSLCLQRKQSQGYGGIYPVIFLTPQTRLLNYKEAIFDLWTKPKASKGCWVKVRTSRRLFPRSFSTILNRTRAEEPPKELAGCFLHLQRKNTPTVENEHLQKSHFSFRLTLWLLDETLNAPPPGDRKTSFYVAPLISASVLQKTVWQSGVWWNL